MQNNQTKSSTTAQQTKPAENTTTPLQTVKITDGMSSSNAVSKSTEHSSQEAKADSKGKEAKAQAPVKMKIATAIYVRMQKNKNVTRKEIIDEFVKEAKLSKAAASTYYQLIKAKFS
ncbi:hypothetical protein RJO15_21065 [Herbaspirillum huttiense F1]|uniref:hypothetical protein n=1 Tax=Herbaspirillum TaxID=963 RepID=UPI0028588FC7|nr:MULTISPECIES: hypothetical protein [Herbaspirillum]MDR6742024.1 hypothetical protein [Herbaspirillum sp. 1173]MDT0358292.1 hypothetical protein [Herbaspirillum huttiense F1]